MKYGNLLWKLLGRKSPKRKPDRRAEFLKAIQKMWLAGALGALFFSIARNLPNHLYFNIDNPNWELTLVIWLQYVYTVCFIAYFMI